MLAVTLASVYAIPCVVDTSLYLVFLLQLVGSLVPTSAKYHSIDICIGNSMISGDIWHKYH